MVGPEGPYLGVLTERPLDAYVSQGPQGPIGAPVGRAHKGPMVYLWISQGQRAAGDRFMVNGLVGYGPYRVAPKGPAPRIWALKAQSINRRPTIARTISHSFALASSRGLTNHESTMGLQGPLIFYVTTMRAEGPKIQGPLGAHPTNDHHATIASAGLRLFIGHGPIRALSGAPPRY